MQKRGMVQKPGMVQKFARLVFACLVLRAAFSTGLRAAPGDLIERHPFGALAPQDIAWDGTLYYVTSFLDVRIFRFNDRFERVDPPLETPFAGGWGLTGIAFNGDPDNPRLWVAEPQSRELREIDLDGQPTGRVLQPAFFDVVNPLGFPMLRGIDFDRLGDERRGSIYVAETVGSLVYEIDLEGTIIRHFNHPDDPDGFPGLGLAAPFSDVGVVRDAGGALSAIHVTGGGNGSIDRLRRLEPDGKYTGMSVPIEQAGGVVAGFKLLGVRARPDGTRVPTLVACVDSKAELVLLDSTEPAMGEIFAFRCVVEGADVALTWQSGSVFDRVEVLRDCRPAATLPGDPHEWRDLAVPSGLHEYRVVAHLGENATTSVTRSAVIGAGRLLRSVATSGILPVDLAVDGRGTIYVSDLYEPNVQVFSDAFVPLGTIELPFLAAEDQLSGIACTSQDSPVLYLYNYEKNVIYAIDTAGSLLQTIPVELPNDPDDPLDTAIVSALSLQEHGAPDNESALWLLELRRELIHIANLDGVILRSFPHPIRSEIPLPDRSGIYHSMGGLSEVPGTDFGLIDLTSGSVFEGHVRRIVRLDTTTLDVVPGDEIPLDGLRIDLKAGFIGIHNARKPTGETVLYAVAASGASSKLVEVEARRPEVRAITGFSARAERGRDRVVLSFRPNDSYDSIRIDRNCSDHLEIPANGFRPGERLEVADEPVTRGIHRYVLHARKGNVTRSTDPIEVWVGPGALLGRSFTHPVRLPYQLTRDPQDETVLVASNLFGATRSLVRFDKDLQPLETLEDVIPAPYDIATLAVRPVAQGTSLTYVIGWKAPTRIGEDQEFPLFVLDRDGHLQRTLAINPPRPTNGFVTYPAGLAWDLRTQTFYYLERNSNSIVRMDLDGRTLETLRHPDPPRQSFVFNLGLVVDPENGTLLLTTAGEFDHRITRILQVTRTGRSTGVEIPVGHLDLQDLPGILLDGSDLVACGVGIAPEFQRVEAFLPIAAPRDIACAGRGAKVLLSWTSPAGAQEVVVLRDGREVARLPAGASSYLDAPPDRARTIVYSVAASEGHRIGKNAVCEAPAASAQGFIRGDADGSGQVDVTDAVVVLTHLFLAGAAPLCDDAADADDSGSLAITDPIRILGRLFLGDGPLPPPEEARGTDPTPDGLGCS